MTKCGVIFHCFWNKTKQFMVAEFDPNVNRSASYARCSALCQGATLNNINMPGIAAKKQIQKNV